MVVHGKVTIILQNMVDGSSPWSTIVVWQWNIPWSKQCGVTRYSIGGLWSPYGINRMWCHETRSDIMWSSSKLIMVYHGWPWQTMVIDNCGHGRPWSTLVVMLTLFFHHRQLRSTMVHHGLLETLWWLTMLNHSSNFDSLFMVTMVDHCQP